METLPVPGERLTQPRHRSRQGAHTIATMRALPIMERAVRVRIHITPGQRAALIAVLDHSPEERVRVSVHIVTFDMEDPRGWLEARMAEWPPAVFPRASLHAVLRKLSAAIPGQVEPDLETPSSEGAGA